jgi:hypothetical protein
MFRRKPHEKTWKLHFWCEEDEKGAEEYVLNWSPSIPIPRVGDTIYLPKLFEGDGLTVISVHFGYDDYTISVIFESPRSPARAADPMKAGVRP